MLSFTRRSSPPMKVPFRRSVTDPNITMIAPCDLKSSHLDCDFHCSSSNGNAGWPRSNSSATGSTSSSRSHSLVHRNPLRFNNPTPSPTSSTGRRSRDRSLSDEDEAMGVGMAESLANTRKEATRRQRIEAEQRRRDELRDGYAKLKDALPISNQKSSKVSLLERGMSRSCPWLNG